jgi:hypothetical protein
MEKMSGYECIECEGPYNGNIPEGQSRQDIGCAVRYWCMMLVSVGCCLFKMQVMLIANGQDSRRLKGSIRRALLL